MKPCFKEEEKTNFDSSCQFERVNSVNHKFEMKDRHRESQRSKISRSPDQPRHEQVEVLEQKIVADTT